VGLRSVSPSWTICLLTTSTISSSSHHEIPTPCLFLLSTYFTSHHNKHDYKKIFSPSCIALYASSQKIYVLGAPRGLAGGVAISATSSRVNLIRHVHWTDRLVGFKNIVYTSLIDCANELLDPYRDFPASQLRMSISIHYLYHLVLSTELFSPLGKCEIPSVLTPAHRALFPSHIFGYLLGPRNAK
jgi:hypothetical protein